MSGTGYHKSKGPRAPILGRCSSDFFITLYVSPPFSSSVDLKAVGLRTGLKRWVYGSVTAKVLRSVNCSMLVIRPTDAELN